MVFVGKDCWTIIASFALSEKDLLSLRQTCKYMNNIIKNADRFNELWFRAFQYFEVRHGFKAKIKDPIQVHPSQLTYRCVPDEHPKLLALKGHLGFVGYHTRESCRRKIFDDGFTVEDCKNKYHWILKVPNNRDDMPMTGYLIECYREKKRKIKMERTTQLGIARRLEDKVSKYNAAKRKAAELDAEYDRNLVFERAKVLTYKGP